MNYVKKLWNLLEIDVQKIINKNFFEQEIKFVEENNQIDYYKHIYLNVNLNPKNLINSHIMYACNKVNHLIPDKFIEKTGESYSLMDIDLDIPMSFRPKLISHIENKYGKDKLAHIITFSRMDGRGALKEVFRILNPVANSFAVANEITANMIDTAKVQDILEDYKEDNPDYSIIDYCIEHVNTIAEYAQEFPREFEIAKKLTSTIRASGIHAAGIVICNEPLSEMFPIDYSRDGTKLVALEMADLEAVGGCKYDILSVAAYEKIGVVEHMIRENLDEVPLPEEGVLDEASV